MSTRQAEQESAALKALSVTVRRELFFTIQRRGPVDIKELIATSGMKEPTIRHHLIILERADLIRSFESRDGARGRPRMLVSATNRHWAIGFPRRQYMLLAEHLLAHVIGLQGPEGAAGALETTGRAVAEQLLGQVRTQKGTAEVTLADIRTFLLPVMDEMGSVVDVLESHEGTLTVQMRNCIFYELAQVHHGIICRAHNAIFQTLADALGDYEAVTTTCLASGDDRCVTCIRPKS